MSQWRAVKARAVLAALVRIGWTLKRQSGSHRTLERSGWPDYVFAFRGPEELAPGCSPASASERGYGRRIFDR